MKYLLDTDTLIYFLKGNQSIVDKIANENPENLITSIITHSELFFGAYNSKKTTSNLNLLKTLFNKIQILPYCEHSSEIYAEEKAKFKKNGTIIADLDLMIASIGIANNCTLVSNNKKHFDRIKKLKITTWN